MSKLASQTWSVARWFLNQSRATQTKVETVHALTILLVSLVAAGCSQQPGSTATANLCMTNMMAVWWELKYWNFNGDSLPPSVGSLSSTNAPGLFVCPSSGHVPGSMTNVEDWTDYIYLSGTDMDDTVLLDVATLICPPENHGGQFGHVVWGGGWVQRLDADKIRALIKEPWCMPTAGRRGISIGYGIPFTEYLRTNTTLHVPARFRSVYPEWHLAYPDGRYPADRYGRS